MGAGAAGMAEYSSPFSFFAAIYTDESTSSIAKRSSSDALGLAGFRIPALHITLTEARDDACPPKLSYRRSASVSNFLPYPLPRFFSSTTKSIIDCGRGEKSVFANWTSMYPPSFSITAPFSLAREVFFAAGAGADAFAPSLCRLESFWLWVAHSATPHFSLPSGAFPPPTIRTPEWAEGCPLVRSNTPMPVSTIP